MPNPGPTIQNAASLIYNNQEEEPKASLMKNVTSNGNFLISNAQVMLNDKP